MAVHIRLSRHGAKKCAFYRIVVTDHRNARDGSFIEQLGTFDPAPAKLELDRGRLAFWTAKGARPSHTLDRILKKNPAPAA